MEFNHIVAVPTISIDKKSTADSQTGIGTKRFTEGKNKHDSTYGMSDTHKITGEFEADTDSPQEEPEYIEMKDYSTA